jgi:hypothetical protein
LSDAAGVPGGAEPRQHPLLAMLLAAAVGRFPPADGAVELLPRPPGRCDAVVGFTAHHVVAVGLPEDEVLTRLPTDDVGAAMDVRFLVWVGDRLRSSPGMLDAVLAAPPSPGVERRARDPMLTEVPAVEHPRVVRAARYRSGLRVFRDDRSCAVVTFGRGLAGRMEVSVEVDPSHREAGLGRALAVSARSLAPADEPLFAQVSPGNAASLRAFLAAGYRPIGAEVLFLRSRQGSGPVRASRAESGTHG